MVALITELMWRGVAYETADGVYSRSTRRTAPVKGCTPLWGSWFSGPLALPPSRPRWGTIGTWLTFRNVSVGEAGWLFEMP